MTKLSRFKADVTKINEGTWVELGEEFGALEIKTRGYTDSYNDARQSKMRRAAVQFGGDTSKLSSSATKQILVDLLIRFCLQDVRNLEDEKGDAITFDQFKELIADDAFADLYTACIVAANRVTLQRDTDLDDVKKSSLKLPASA